MNDIYDDIDENSRDAAENIHFGFDDKAWDKMKALLDEEDDTTVPPVFLNNTAATNNNKGNWLLLLLFFTITIGSLLIFKKYNTSKNAVVKTTADNIKTTETNTIKQSPLNNKESIDSFQENKQANNNKTFIPKATKAKQTTVTTIQALINNEEIYKKKKDVIAIKSKDKKNLKIKEVELKDIVFNKPTNNIEYVIKENIVNNKRTNNSKNKTIVKIKQPEVEEEILNKTQQTEIGKTDIINNVTSTNLLKPQIEKVKIINIDSSKKKDITALKTTGASSKKDKATSKNKVLKNIGFTVFASPELNTVKYKGVGKVTLGYGVGLNYTIGKHFIVMAQFAKSQKVYVTDRNGYNPPAGSPFLIIDTLNVQANCTVWDIPLNIRYSFKTNNKTSFFISAGISSYIMKKEVYDFNYYDQGIYKTKQRTVINENKHSFSNLNLSFGYQYWFNKKWSAGIEPYLKLPINGVGLGKVNITSAGTLFNLTFKPW